jgi:hypothetical protein
VQVIRRIGDDEERMLECFSQTFKQNRAGDEFNLQHAIETTVSNAMKYIEVHPASCIVWRDGVSKFFVVPESCKVSV